MAVPPVQTLAMSSAGVNVTITGFVEGDDEAVRKLLALGLVPGDALRLLSTWPAFVFELGSTSYAVDTELAQRILVTETTVA
jgi:Fe2+ transport system protein FeoA